MCIGGLSLYLCRWIPKGQLIAHIHDHKDAINRYVVHDSSHMPHTLTTLCHMTSCHVNFISHDMSHDVVSRDLMSHDLVSHDLLSHDQDQSAPGQFHVCVLLKRRMHEAVGRQSDRGQDGSQQTQGDLQSPGRQDQDRLFLSGQQEHSHCLFQWQHPRLQVSQGNLPPLKLATVLRR